MPRDDAAVLGRLAEELVVPESHGPTQQLRRRREQRRMPEDVVQSGPDPPRAERMKQHRAGVARLVRVVLVPQLAAVVVGCDEFGQFGAQSFDLPLVEEPNAGQETRRGQIARLVPS